MSDLGGPSKSNLITSRFFVAENAKIIPNVTVHNMMEWGTLPIARLEF